jgi:hypothetical protein
MPNDISKPRSNSDRCYRARSEPRPLSHRSGRVRGLVAGAVPAAWPAPTIPDKVGFLALSKHGVGVPYGLTSRKDRPGRTYASVIGHEYLCGYGANSSEAVTALEDVVAGFAGLV